MFRAVSDHLVRAALEGIGYSCQDIVEAMMKDTGLTISFIKADGGASKNDFILQFFVDIMNANVERSKVLGMTAIGAGYLVGLAVDYWKSTENKLKNRKVDKVFTPKMDENVRKKLIEEWRRAVERSRRWVKLAG